MAADEPPYLNVGTDVSAKYKGAFCEAKIKKVDRSVKCKVTFKNNLGSAMIPDDQIKGLMKAGAEVEARHPEKNQYCGAIINKLQDCSRYTVVFDDGDETTLRRTSLCLKSGRHFAESPTLDQFPLTNPEHFGTPVIGTGKSKRKRRSTMNSASVDYESSDEEIIPRKVKTVRGKDRDPDLGKVVCVDFGDRRKKDNWYPGLVVSNPVQSNIKITRDEYLIRSFKDGKYYQVPKRDTREFTKDCIQRVENNSLRTAVEKAILYYEKEELPPHWDKALYMGLDLSIADEESHDSDSDTSDDEPSEEKDRFVAQLYKFMDERGTPINKAPAVGTRDLNLYKLFKIMHKMGGYNKVTNQNKWKTVYIKMGLPSPNSASSNQIKLAYKRYLHSFEDFYRKLGCTMVSNSRTTRGRHRSDRNIIITRTRDRDAASPKGKIVPKDVKDKVQPDKKLEERSRHTDKREVKSEESLKSEDKLKTPDKKKPEKIQSDDKDKLKKDEKPRLVRSQSLNKDKKETVSKDEGKKELKPEKARTREDARKEKNESPEKKGTRSSSKVELKRKEKEESERKDSPPKDKKEKPFKEKEKKEEKSPKEVKDEKMKDKKDEKIKEKKDDKNVKDKKNEKLLKDKKIDDKPMKEKDKMVRDKREDNPKLLREKKDLSKDQADEKEIKCKIEERLDKVPIDDKSKIKKERIVKEKREEKFFRSRKEDKSPLSESSRKTEDSSSSKSVKDERDNMEKGPKEIEVKKEDQTLKDRPKYKFLRERKEGTSLMEESDDDDLLDLDSSKNESGTFQESDNDSFYRRGPGSRSGMEDMDYPSKGKRRSFKPDDRDEKESLLGLTDSDDESFLQDCDRGDLKGMKQGEIEIGDRVKVKYGRGRMQKVYEAKVLKIDANGVEKRYYVHYAGWNMRYDEWVRKSYIVASMSDSNRFSRKQKQELNTTTSPSSSSTSSKKIDRSRPPGALLNAMPVRKNSTSSTNSSISCPRATRSDKKSLQTSPFSSGLKPRKRLRKKSGISTGLTDTSQDSYSDGEDPMAMDMDDDLEDTDPPDNSQGQTNSSYKEELFSDDEEKEKLEEVKREDITELEKAISVEETTSDNKDSFLSKLSMAEDIMKEKPEEKKPLESVPSSESIKKELPAKVSKAKAGQDEKCEIHVKTEIASFSKKPAGSMIEGKIEKQVQSTGQLLPQIVNPNVFLENSPTTSKPSSNSASYPAVPEKTEVSKPAPSSNSGALEFPVKRSYLPVTPSPTSERNLSFAGLHGLIQKSTHEKISHPDTSFQKDKFMKVGTSVLSNAQILKPSSSATETKLLDKTKCKVPSVISESSTASKTEPISKVKEMPLFKETSTSIAKSTSIDKKLENKSDKVNDKPCGILGEIKPDATKKDNTINKNVFESKVVPQPESTVKPISNVLEGSNPSTSVTKPFMEIKKEIAPKDSFDYLIASSSCKTLQDRVRTPEVKSIFPLSFTSTPMREKFSSEQHSHNKPISLLSEGISAIKPKPTETVDLSKAIPGILERLKKDVVAETKFSDSPPPPQRDELNFDFLYASHEGTKSLSHSDSSNSLRICEDMSDTNDSNNDSRELTIPKKLELTHRTGIGMLNQFISISNIGKAAVPDESKKIPEESKKPPIESSPFLEDQTSLDESKKLAVESVKNIDDTKKICSESKKFLDDKINEEKKKVSDGNKELLDDNKKVSNDNKKLPSENKKQEKLPIAAKATSETHDEFKETKSQAQQTSVITAAATAALSVLSAVSLPESNDNRSFETCIATIKDNFSKSVEPNSVSSAVKKEESLFVKNDETSLCNDIKSENLSISDNTSNEIDKEIPKVPKTDKSYSEHAQTSNITQERKHALFDDLLKIKSTNTFPQDSVIKRAPDSEKNASQNVLEIPVVEDKASTIESNTDDMISAELDKEVVELAKDVHIEEDAFDKLKNECPNPVLLSEYKAIDKDVTSPEEDSTASVIKKEGRKKKSKLSKLEKRHGSSDGLEKDESKEGKSKEGKGKKKRTRLENDDLEKGKSKKMKKKNKKRFAKHDDQFSEYLKKFDLKEEENKESMFEKSKKREKRKNEKKFMKGGMKSDEGADARGELIKKKKGKKNRDKFGNEKKDSSEKKLKKKKKLHLEDNLGSDSENDCTLKIMDKKKKKERKKFKAKDGSSSDEGHNDNKIFKQQGKDLSGALPRQDSKSDDPDMSFLLCEEKVPASPVDIIRNLPDDSSGSSSNDENNMQLNSEPEQIQNINRFQRVDHIGPLNPMSKHNLDTCAVLDNTPPTTPSSTESLLSSSPSHDRDAFSLNYPESTQSGRESGEGEPDVFHCNSSHRTVMRESAEYCAAATLAFAVCKSVSEKPKDISHSFLKRQKSESEDHSPSKRKKKSKRMRRSSESAKSPRHKSSLSRLPKDESGCEDSSGTSPATSNSPPYLTSTISTSFSRSASHCLASITDSASRYSFYVPLHDKDPEKRISILQDKMTQLRKEYMALKAEVAMIDRRRKKARKKVRDTAGSVATNPSVQSEDGQSCS